MSPAQTPQPAPVPPEIVGRQLMIIQLALMFGLISFAVVALVVRPPQMQAEAPGILAYLAAGMFVLSLVLRSVLPGVASVKLVEQAMEKQPEDVRAAVVPAFMSKTIIGAAILEGAGFFNLVAYIVDEHWLSLVAAGLVLVVLAITIPSQAQFEEWADRVRRDHL